VQQFIDVCHASCEPLGLSVSKVSFCMSYLLATKEKAGAASFPRRIFMTRAQTSVGKLDQACREGIARDER
jgi:hypothetical protein